MLFSYIIPVHLPSCNHILLESSSSLVLFNKTFVKKKSVPQRDLSFDIPFPFLHVCTFSAHVHVMVWNVYFVGFRFIFVLYCDEFYKKSIGLQQKG